MEAPGELVDAWSKATGADDSLARAFETLRGHLRRVAYRMLGSLGEAEDAVQEAWLRLSRSETNDIDNLGGWLTTVVSRVCLDMLRSRKVRGEEPIDESTVDAAARVERPRQSRGGSTARRFSRACLSRRTGDA